MRPSTDAGTRQHGLGTDNDKRRDQLNTTADTRRRRRSTLAIAAIAALGGLAIAGCGGGSDSSSSTAATTGASGATGAQGAAGGASTVNVSETDFKLNPDNPTVQAGNVTVNATNDGQVTHSIEVEGPNGDQELKSDLAAGQSGTLTVDLTKPGKYEFYCPIDNHKQMGMVGEITVK
jgi:uncharacterized cupredoxin-like copper-binding protein